MAYEGRSTSPKRGRTVEQKPLPIIVKVSLGALALVASVVLLTHLNPSPWLSSHPAIFLRPPPPLSSLSSSITPPVEGCQNVQLTRLEKREKAAIVLLLREQDLGDLLPTLDNFESRFNARFRYPYVFIASPDEGDFSDDFRRTVLKALPSSAEVEWSLVERQHWSVPEWLDEESVRRGFKEQEARGVQYAGREGYHHMIRWYSGLWAREKVLEKYDWYWRLEPGGELLCVHSSAPAGLELTLLAHRRAVRFYCSITYDPFRFMAVHNKVYGFVIAIVENMNTIPSLFKTIKSHAERNGIKTQGKALWDEFLTKREGGKEEEYTGCHHWTNFEARRPTAALEVVSSALTLSSGYRFADRRPSVLSLSALSRSIRRTGCRWRLLHRAGEPFPLVGIQRRS